MDRLKNAFELITEKGNPGVIPFLTVGFPSVKDTIALVQALEQSGAAVIELGVPFSDPLADGPTIQRSSFHALENGVNLGTCLDVCKKLREIGVKVPLVLMGYYNPFFAYGIETFARDANASGVDGVIVPDLPYEESGSFANALSNNDIHLIPLLAPTSTDERIAKSCKAASGFVYCVSLTGVTGARDEIPDGAFTITKRIRKQTSLPIAVGFGISKRKHVEALSNAAQAAVVGSALIQVIENNDDENRIQAVKDFLIELTG
jgi:tryptophan synthase alpha chain